MTETVPITKIQSILTEVNELQHQVARRAYEIYLGKGGLFGRDLDNWLQAEQELVWMPAVDLREKNGTLELSLMLPELYSQNMEIQVTPEDILIKAELSGDYRDYRDEKETVHRREMAARMFRAIHLPRRIDPDKVKAQFEDGILTITAEIEEDARANRVAAEAA